MEQLHRDAANQHELAAEQHRYAAETDDVDEGECGECAVAHSNRAYELAREVLDSEGNR